MEIVYYMLRNGVDTSYILQNLCDTGAFDGGNLNPLTKGLYVHTIIFPP